LNVCEELKKQGYERTVLIMLKSKDGKVINDPLKSLEVTGCLFKPFDPEMLLSVIENL